MKDELFRDMPVPQAVLKLVIPTMLGMIVTIIYNMVDTFLSDRLEIRCRLPQFPWRRRSSCC